MSHVSLPDLSHAGTLGELLGVVRDLWTDSSFGFSVSIGRGDEMIECSWGDSDSGDSIVFPSLAEALVAALEAAP